MRLGADGAQRHCASGKTLDNVRSRLHLVHRNGFGRLEFEFKQPPQRHVAAALVVDDLGVLFISAPVVGAGAVLKLGNGIGCPHVLLATGAPSVFATGFQHGVQNRVLAKSGDVGANGFFLNFEHANAFDAAGCAGEVFAHGFGVDANDFKQLGAAVAHVGGHPHLGHDLGQALTNGLDVVVNGFVSTQVTGQAGVQLLQSFHGQVRVNCLSTVACQDRKVVHLARSAGFHHQTGRGAQALTHQMLVNGRQGQQRWDRHLGGRNMPVAHDQDVVAALDGVHRFGAQRGQLGLHAFVSPSQGVGDV